MKMLAVHFTEGTVCCCCFNIVFVTPGAVVGDGREAMGGVKRYLYPNMAFEREGQFVA